jgi:hypothetical protein
MSYKNMRKDAANSAILSIEINLVGNLENRGAQHAVAPMIGV